MGEVKQHMVDAHGTEDVELDLSPICTCGSEMRHTFTEPKQHGLVLDHVKCDKCGNAGTLARAPRS